MSQSVTLQIANYAAETSIDRLPGNVREKAKRVIFDEMMCACFGRRSIAGGLAAKYAISVGGPGEAMILGSAARVPAPYAALANGTAGHGEEVDGTHLVGGHPGASIVHAALGMAERQRASGADLINAVVLGYDIGTRIVAACGGKFVVRKNWHLTSDCFFAFGAAVASGRILGLDPLRLCHALALVSFQTNGLHALYKEKRHISKSFCNGQYAFAGISAAQMSAAGLEGNEDIIGAHQGLLDAWGSEEDKHRVAENLGGDYAILGANFKFLNAGHPIHTPVEAAMSLIGEKAIKVDSIEAIEVGMPENVMRVVDNAPMHNICVQDMLAASIVLGGIALADTPFPNILKNPAFQSLRSRIAVVVDPEIERTQPNGRGARVTMMTTNGQRYQKKIDHPRGHSQRGEVTWFDLREKWESSLPDHDVGLMFSLAEALEELQDVCEITKAFSQTRQ